MEGLGSSQRTRDGKNGQGKRAQDTSTTRRDASKEQTPSESGDIRRQTVHFTAKGVVHSSKEKSAFAKGPSDQDAKTEQPSPESGGGLRQLAQYAMDGAQYVGKAAFWTSVIAATAGSAIEPASAKGLPHNDANALSRRGNNPYQSNPRHTYSSYDYSNGGGRGGDSSHQRKRGYPELPDPSYGDAHPLSRRGDNHYQSNPRYEYSSYDNSNGRGRVGEPRYQSDGRYEYSSNDYSDGRSRRGESRSQSDERYAFSSYGDAHPLSRRGDFRSQPDGRYPGMPDSSDDYSNERGRRGDFRSQPDGRYPGMPGSSYDYSNERGRRGDLRSQSDGRYAELSGSSERRRGQRHSDYPSQYTSRDYDEFSPAIQIGNREYVQPTIDDINTLLQDKRFPKFMEKVCQSPEVLANLLKNSNFRDSLSPMFYDENIQMYFREEVCKDPKRQQMLLNTHKKIFPSDWKVPTLVGTSAIAILSTAAFLYFNSNRRGKSAERQNLQQQQEHRQDPQPEIQSERQKTNYNDNQSWQEDKIEDREPQLYAFVKSGKNSTKKEVKGPIVEEASDDDAQGDRLNLDPRRKDSDSDRSMISYSRPRRQDDHRLQRITDSLQEMSLTKLHDNQLDSHSNRLHESEKIKEVAQMLTNMFASSVVKGKGEFKFFDEDEVQHVDGRVTTRRQGIAFNFERPQESIINQEESKFDAEQIKHVERELNVQEKKKMHETFVNSPCGSQIRAQMNEFGSVPLFKALLETRGKGFTSRSHIFNNAYVLSFFMKDKEVQKFLAKKEESQPYWDVINRDLRLYDWNYTEFVCAKQQGKRLLEAEREMSRKDRGM